MQGHERDGTGSPGAPSAQNTGQAHESDDLAVRMTATARDLQQQENPDGTLLAVGRRADRNRPPVARRPR